MAQGKRPCNLALNIVPVSQFTNSDFNRSDCSGCAFRCTKSLSKLILFKKYIKLYITFTLTVKAKNISGTLVLNHVTQ